MRRRTLITAAMSAAVVQCVLTSILAAQSPVGSVSGTVFDSLTSRPMSGALVEVAGSERMATTDRQGRFRIDSLPVGTHRISFSALELDTIGLFGFARDVQVRAGAIEDVVLSSPSFRTLHSQLCAAAATPTADSAIVFGTVYDAVNGQPVDSARVHFAWTTTGVGSGGVQRAAATREVRTASGGGYGLCGLPSDAALLTHARSARAASGRVITRVGIARILRRDIYVSSAMPLDDGAKASRGSGTIKGVVRNASGGRVARVEVRVLSVDTTVTTDAEGQFSVERLPLGTQQVDVRAGGVRAASAIAHVREGQMADVELVMVEPSAIATVGMGPDRAAFERRRTAGLGTFLDGSLVTTQPSIATVLRKIGELQVITGGATFDVSSIRNRCTPAIVVDGRRVVTSDRATLAAMRPRQMRAVEYYDDEAGLPVEYSGGIVPRCGMLIVWTTAARW